MTLVFVYRASQPTAPPPTTTPPAGPSPVRRMVWRSPGITCRRPRSSGSPARSPSTATTASCTRSGSWWRGWWRCCWSPSRCATPAASRWATCWLPDAPAAGARCGRDSTLVVSAVLPARADGGAGGLIDLLLGPVDGRVGAGVVIAVVGALMIVYVLVGGMRGTTCVQIIKAALLLVGAAVITAWVLGIYGFNLSTLLRRGRRGEPHGEACCGPGCSTARRPRSSTSCPSRWRWC